ncbi:MAG: hypothetical protein LBI69_04000 [Puniceicoccales bacterium]|jgi:protein arginine kinase|nr:hypothetical protein [Puniceicoccales bacterium]
MNPLIKKIGQQNHPFGSAQNSSAPVILYTQACLSRNIEELIFPQRASAEELSKAQCLIAEAAKSEFPNYDAYGPLDFSKSERIFFVERKWTTKRWSRTEAGGLVVSPTGSTVMAINGEDHIRIRCITRGLNLESVAGEANAFANGLAGRIRYAFDLRLGYLIARSQNVGFALQIKICAHLPGLAVLEKIQSFFMAARAIGCSMVGLNGKKAQTDGEIFTISYAIPLDVSEDTAIENMGHFMETVIESELAARKTLLDRSQLQMRDRISRVLAVLKSAHIVELKEARSLLMHMRLAVDYGWLECDVRNLIDQLLIDMQTHHLFHCYEIPIHLGMESTFRAEILRNKFQSIALL